MEKWNAKWIWVDERRRGNNQYIEARRELILQQPPAKADLRITANQQYLLFVNGIAVGRGPSPCDNGFQYFDSYEIAPLLRPGKNAIAVVAYNFGTDAIVTGQRQGPGGLLVQVDLYPQGEGESPDRSFSTDEAWNIRVSPRWRADSIRMHMWGGYREIYLADREDGWEQPDYGASDWSAATVVAKAEAADSPWPKLLGREIPPLRSERLKPVRLLGELAYMGTVGNGEALLRGGDASGSLVVDASVPGSYPQLTYDFGAEVVGYPGLVVDAPEGGIAQLYYGEGLEMALTDTFVLKKGENRLRTFGRRAFRFMKLAFMATPVPVRVAEADIEFVHYPYREDGSFVCSDELMNRIWEVGKYTAVVNSQDHFEDCPHREAALWVADAVIMARVSYQTFGDRDLVRKCLLQSGRIQTDDGAIPGTGPEGNPFTLPDFCAHWTFGVKEYFDYSGDRTFLAELWPVLIKLADWFERQEGEDGLFADANRDGWWCFIDWSDDIERKDKVTAISCYYYKFLLTFAELARRMEEPERADRLEAKAARLRETIRARLRVPGSSLFADCLSEEGLSASITAQTNFVAIWCGIMEPEEAEQFIDRHYLAGKLPPIRGAFFYHIVLDVLFSKAYRNAAMANIRSFWGSMLDRGATTWWETFDPSLPECTVPSPYMGHTPTYMQEAIPVSFSHGWGASPTYLLTRDVLGVDASKLGQGVVEFRPSAAGGLSWAKGTIPVPGGVIEASWSEKEAGEFGFEARFPANLGWTGAGLKEVQTSREGEYTLVKGLFTSDASEYSLAK